VDVVEVHDAVTWYAVPLGGELEFGNQIRLCSRQRGDGYSPDPIGNRIPREHEHGPVTAGCRRKPDLTPPHGSKRCPIRPVLCRTPSGDFAERQRGFSGRKLNEVIALAFTPEGHQMPV
jgi:hypothetical protein